MNMRRMLLAGLSVVGLLSMIVALPAMAQTKTRVVLWHSYRGDERNALEKVAKAFNAQSKDIELSMLAVPFDAFPDKVSNAVPQGKGPDLFIFAHDRIGNWAESKVIEPIDFFVDDEIRGRFLPQTMTPLTYRRKLYGLPLAFKSTVLFYNKDLVTTPPRTTDEMIEIAKKHTDKDAKRYGLVYEYANFYMHAAWFHGYGARVFDASGQPTLNTPESAESFKFVQDLRNVHGIVPEESTSVLVTSLFNEGKAAMIINGPWVRAELSADLNYGVAPLPTVSATGKPAMPFMGSEGVLMSAKSKNMDKAFDVMNYLTGSASASIRLTEGKQPVANAAICKTTADPIIKVFLAQLDSTVPMPNTPQMLQVWSPITNALNAIATGGAAPEKALEKAQQEIVKNIESSRR